MALKGKDFYYLGEQRITDDQYLELIKNCPDAWNYYEKGMKQRKTGRILLIIGGGCIVAGAIVGLIDGGDGVLGGAVAGAYGTAVASLVSIPFFISGKNKKNDAYKIYNQYCVKPKATLSFRPTANSIGVCLNF